MSPIAWLLLPRKFQVWYQILSLLDHLFEEQSKMVKDTDIGVCTVSRPVIFASYDASYIGENCGKWHRSWPVGILGLSHPASLLRAQDKVEVLPFEDCSVAKPAMCWRR